MTTLKVWSDTTDLNFNVNWVDVDIDVDKLHGCYGENKSWKYGILSQIIQNKKVAQSAVCQNIKHLIEEDINFRDVN